MSDEEKWAGIERRNPPWSSDVDTLHERIDRLENKLGATLEKLGETLTSLHGEVRDHIAQDAPIAPAVAELVTLYKGSKIMLPLVIGAVTFGITLLGAGWALLAWLRDHLRW